MDLDHDLHSFDGAVAVTYVTVRPDGETELPIATALRRAVTLDESRLLAPQVALTPHDVAWHVPASELHPVAPAAGDRIVANDEVWIVTSATHVTLQSRWRIFCRRAQ